MRCTSHCCLRQCGELTLLASRQHDSHGIIPFGVDVNAWMNSRVCLWLPGRVFCPQSNSLLEYQSELRSGIKRHILVSCVRHLTSWSWFTVVFVMRCCTFCLDCSDDNLHAFSMGDRVVVCFQGLRPCACTFRIFFRILFDIHVLLFQALNRPLD
jgi:hypothetical protein